MFFSQDILQKRGGKFGIIWIAATKATQLTKRDYCSVNVRRTCEDIIRYLTLNASPQHEGRSRPRLSLYLSSQLMYGVVRVYDRQQEYLIMDATNLSVKFHSALPIADIDLRLPLRSDHVTNPDVAELNKDLGVDLDPEFGVMRSADVLHPDDLPAMDFWAISSGSIADLISPVRTSIPTLPFPSPPLRVADLQDVEGAHQTSLDRITLKESPIPVIMDDIQFPGESELPPLEMENLLQLSAHAGIETDASKTESDDNITADKQALPIAEVTPTLMPEMGEMPERVARPPPTPGVTPIMQPESRKRLHRDFNLELSPATPPSTKRARHRRQLLFADQLIQMSRDQQKRAVRTGHMTTRPMVLPDPHAKSLTDLFGCPGRKDFGKRLEHLWKRNARSRGVTRADQDDNRPAWTVPQLGETSSSSESSRLVVEAAAQADDDMQHISVEVHRGETSMASEHLGPADITSLHGSLLTRSRDSTMLDNISDAESIHKEGTVQWDIAADGTFIEDAIAADTGVAVTNQLDILQEIPEEQDLVASPVLPPGGEGPTRLAASPDYQTFLRLLTLRTRKEPWTTFLEICPLTTPRAIVAKMFSGLLDVCAMRKVEVKQTVPYGDIYICRGRHWR